jgi:hypothetical protein
MRGTAAIANGKIQTASAPKPSTLVKEGHEDEASAVSTDIGAAATSPHGENTGVEEEDIAMDVDGDDDEEEGHDTEVPDVSYPLSVWHMA